jgi:hypothetical protein
MTTTTRTTRKAPWAAALTALLAVLALVFGALAFAGVANAKDDNPNKPDDPGNSQNAPGHDGVPPGQQDDGTPGNSDGVPGGGNDNSAGPTKVWICHADTNNGNGQPNLGQGGTGGENKTGFNILYISVNAWENGHKDRHPADKVFESEAQALAACGPTTPTAASLCDLAAVPPAMTTFADNTSAAYLAALADAQATTHTRYALSCPTPPLTPTAASLCDLAAVPPAMATFADNTSAAYLAALADAQATTHSRYALSCPITDDEAAAIDAALGTVAPEPVTAVEAATVTQEPETVAVPAPATVALPATVPAGDGSSAPQMPVALLALLALATAAAVTSGLRMATNR